MNTDTVFLIVLTFFSTSNLDDFFIYEQEEKTKNTSCRLGEYKECVIIILAERAASANNRITEATEHF